MNPPPPHVTRRAFLSNLRRSGLVSSEQLDHAQELAPGTERGRVLARALVEQGLLTRFQAERLLVGLTDGFRLDQYLILEELGRGGMGRVYKARHETMGRVVALKVLAPGLTRTPRAVELFLREVRAAAQLVHPNVVTAFDASLSGDRYYLVLEYVHGPNLDQLVRDRGPLDIGQACDFVRQAACGLQAAHALGMVHRDVKPSNLLVQLAAGAWSPDQTPARARAARQGLVKVSDFGLARLQAPEDHDGTGTILTRPNTVMGTPDYLSPEQARNLHKTDIRSDLYSLGGTLYFLLTGRVPFPGGNALEKLIRHNTEEPTPLEELRPEVPPAVAAIVRKLMAKHPADRYQTPAELVEALEPFSVSGPTPWDSSRVTSETLPEGTTPLPGAEPLVPGGRGLEETFPPEPSLTPLPADGWPLRLRRSGRPVLAWLAAAGLIALGALGAFLLSR